MLESLRVRPQIRARLYGGPVGEHIDAFVVLLHGERQPLTPALKPARACEKSGGSSGFSGHSLRAPQGNMVMVYETRIERVSVKVHFVEGRECEMSAGEFVDDDAV